MIGGAREYTDGAERTSGYVESESKRLVTLIGTYHWGAMGTRLGAIPPG